MRRLLSTLLATLLVGPAAAGTLKLATWNLEWLTLAGAASGALPRDVVPRRPADFARLRAYAGELNADVVAFEEVDGPAPAQLVFPADRYVLQLTGDHVVQRVGLAIRRGIAFSVNPDVTALDVNGPTSVHPLRSGLDVTLRLGPGRALRLLVVHLKSGCQQGQLERPAEPCVALRKQIPIVQAWIAARQSEGVAFAIIGDFNRVMDAPDKLIEDLRTAAPLARATEGAANPCWGGERFIDHILLGGDAIVWLVPDSLRVLVYRETDDEARSVVSDHCPVSVRLTWPG
jgi:endonuclease/exonuclease/phosphatase family metal-dependent hydrolase